MDTPEKAKLAVQICRIERFSISGILIYNSKTLDMNTTKKRIRRLRAIEKPYVFHANKIRQRKIGSQSLEGFDVFN